MSTYVVGVDGSDTAATAAARAGDLAAKTGATVHVVCAFSGKGTTVWYVGCCRELGIFLRLFDCWLVDRRGHAFQLTFIFSRGSCAAAELHPFRDDLSDQLLGLAAGRSVTNSQYADVVLADHVLDKELGL